MKKTIALLMALVMVLCLLPSMTLAAGNSTVVLHPSVNHTVTGVKVKVGDKIDGHSITKISKYDITVDLGKYNVNNDTFRLPYAKDIWEGVDNNKVDYISWAGIGSNKKSEGASAQLANGKNTAYYYFKGAPTYKTFTLKYDANGGTDAPATQTYTATSQYENSHTFTISNDEPTRQDYEFKGWAETPNATTATRQPGGKIVVTGTTTLYAIWEENQPERLTLTYDKNITGNPTNIPAPQSKPKDGNGEAKFPIPTDIPTLDGFTFLNWNTNNNGEGTKYERGSEITINQDTTLYAIWEENYTPNPSAPPDKPDDHDTLKSLLGKIKVTCVTNDAAHGTKEFDLIADSYTVGDVEGSANSGYTCEVSISPDKYVEAYNAELSLVHTTDDTAKTVTLKCNDDSAWVVYTGTPVEFNVKCETEQPTPPPSAPPAKPDDHDTLKSLLGKIKVTCVTSVTAHGTKGFDLIDGSYTVGAVGGDAISGYTCEVSISPDKYVDEYNKLINGHTVTEATAKIVTLKSNNDSAWVVDRGTPVEFNVTCSDEDKTFTVTYLDGFSGTYATYTNLKSGDATPVPANPYRSGYIFLGWQPSVARTVTGDARYVAQWGYIGPQYPNPTPVQPVQPGILPPQTGDMPLWYAIARFLGLVK